MKYIIATMLIIASIPAFADEGYNAGYNAGYYNGTRSQYQGSQYGHGYEDGIYDADLEDTQARQRSEEFEAALVHEQYHNDLEKSGEGNNSDINHTDLNSYEHVSEDHSGSSVTENDSLLRLANSGDADAQQKLGLKYWADAYVDEMMKEGSVPPINQAVTHSYADAIIWFRKAAAQGNEMAQVELGEAYRDGKGVTQSYTEAIKWFNKAVHNGTAIAEYDLALLYENGWGVPKNYVIAQKWYILAARPPAGKETVDHVTAVKDRDRLAAHMNSDQLAEAQKLAQEWKPE